MTAIFYTRNKPAPISRRPWPGRLTAYLFRALFLLLLICAGCKSDLDQPELSSTVLLRRQIDPKAGLFLMQAEQAFRQGTFNAALRLADSAEYYAPELADVPYLQGLTFTELGQLDQAQTAFQKVAVMDPYYRGVWFKLGNNAFRREQYREAVELYRKERKVAREEEQASRQDFDRVRHRTALLQLGRVYFELGNMDSALLAYEEAIVIDPSYAEAYSDLGVLYRDNGDYEKAIVYWRRALELDPEDVDYHYFLGLLLWQTGRAEEAIGYLKMAVEQRPWHPGAHYNLGQALISLGRMEEGQRCLAGADSIRALDRKIELGRFRVKISPDEPRYLVELARLLRRAGRYDEAMDAYKVALYLAPQSVTIQLNMAHLSLSLGDTTGAIRRFRALLQQDPSLDEVWVNLGEVYALTGRVGEARRAWQNALRYKPDHPKARAFLAKFSETP